MCLLRPILAHHGGLSKTKAFSLPTKLTFGRIFGGVLHQSIVSSLLETFAVEKLAMETE